MAGELLDLAQRTAFFVEESDVHELIRVEHGPTPPIKSAAGVKPCGWRGRPRLKLLRTPLRFVLRNLSRIPAAGGGSNLNDRYWVSFARALIQGRSAARHQRLRSQSMGRRARAMQKALLQGLHQLRLRAFHHDWMDR